MAYKVSVWMPNDKEVLAEFDDIETAELFFEGFKIGGAFKRVSLFEDRNIIREWKNDEKSNGISAYGWQDRRGN